MDRLTDRLACDLKQQTMQVQRMLACKGAMEVAEAQALCNDIEQLRTLLQSLRQRVVSCANKFRAVKHCKNHAVMHTNF